MRSKDYYKMTLEERKAYNKKRYQAHREESLERSKKYYQEHKEKIREYNKRYTSSPEYKEKRRERNKIFRSTPEYKERRKKYDIKYRIKKYNKEIYRHWGNSQFVPVYFTPVTNNKFSNKPHGGLWACPTKDVDIKWDDWCRSENFMTDRLDKHFDFILKRARILEIKDIADLDKLPRIYVEDKSAITNHCIMDLNANIDFEEIAKKYDAIKVWMYRSSDIPEESIMDGMYYRLYGWDVDTLLVLNPDIIEVIGESE